MVNKYINFGFYFDSIQKHESKHNYRNFLIKNVIIYYHRKTVLDQTLCGEFT